MINEGMKNLAAGANPIILRKGMKKATNCAVDAIASMSSKVNGKLDLLCDRNTVICDQRRAE